MGVAGDAVGFHRAGGERSWSLCGPSAAKLEAVAAMVRTVITSGGAEEIGGEIQRRRNMRIAALCSPWPSPGCREPIGL